MQFKHYALLIFLAAIWGASFLFLRISSPEFGPFALIFLRTFIAALALLPVFWGSYSMRVLYRHWPTFVVVGGVGTALPFVLISYSALQLSAGFMSIINAMVPLSSTVIAYFMLKESFSLRQFIGLFSGVIGVAVMSYERFDTQDLLLSLPIVAGLASTVFYAYSSCFSKLKLGALSAIEVAFGSQVYGALLTLPLALFFWPAAMPGAQAWFSLIMLAVICTSLALVFFFHLIKSVGVGNTLLVTYLIPLFGVLWGYLLLQESVQISLLMGAVFILFGVGYASRNS